MSEREQPVRVGVVGLGYWGPNLARNLDAIPGCELRWLCDPRAEAREKLARSFPGARATGELSELLGDEELDAVVLATPVPTHAELAIRVAQAGKHCFVEKPLATTAADAERAVQAARRRREDADGRPPARVPPGGGAAEGADRRGRARHAVLPVRQPPEPGRLRGDENALWSLGAHDVSVVLHLIGEEP